jgi:GNAT superfamily N-acetyltransferase
MSENIRNMINKVKNFKHFINEELTNTVDDDYVYYYINNEKIGFIEYYYDGGTFSENIPNIDKEKEFYIAMIGVYDKFRGNNYSSQMLNFIKKFAKEKGATIITLRVDNGLGFTKRTPNTGLEKRYLQNGIKYFHNEDEYNLNNDLNLGAMYFNL